MLSIKFVVEQANQDSPIQRIIVDAIMAIDVSFANDKPSHPFSVFSRLHPNRVYSHANMSERSVTSTKALWFIWFVANIKMVQAFAY